MGRLKDKLSKLIPIWRNNVSTLSKEHGKIKIDEVELDQALGGMRDIKSMVCETSYLDPMEGIRFRNYTIPEVREKLPKPEPNSEAYPTGLWYLLLTGEIPSKDDVLEIEDEFKVRASVPEYVFNVIKALPSGTHPMTQFAVGILALQKDSIFAKKYNDGMKKTDYWEPMLEDSMNLLAKLPGIAAYIYRHTYKDGKIIPAEPKLDWGANFAHMMGVDNPEYKNLMRLYLILHSDHESGNVSAHAGHLIASALSDVYYSISGAMDGLAGPLHGLANQECLKWIMDLYNKYNGIPTKEQVEQFTNDTLNSGKVIPGYGHAVLRKTDPRYTAQREFALKFMPDDPLFKTVSNIFDVVPNVLMKQGKAKNPWPNVDAHSGVLQYHYGVKEFDFYTVLFGVSRALGITAQIVWDRAVGAPLERPKSVTLQMLKEAILKA
ncbi:MAG: citrate (Si)-synthase, eukaryotic [Deltaproteobacteria bacterium]|nr:citrate (Si)-synthase, eukaryotic [Deltaproteobacteria bacterium]MCL5792850.1 citrate (Si)-synthase, eukaryotic [Deltaproteobacteria bacterium]